jgi:hypothetical protein
MKPKGLSLPAFVSGQYLTNNGTVLSWAPISFTGYLKADGTVPLTADWNVGAFDLTAVDVNATRLLLGNGSTSAVAFGPSAEPTTGLYFETGKIRVQVGGTILGFFAASNFWMVPDNSYIAWRNGNTLLYSSASDNLDQRRSTNPQSFNVYGTWASATSYERGFLRSTAGAVEMGSAKGGAGGSARPVNIYVDETLREQFSTTAGNRTLVGPQAQTTTDGFATVVVTLTNDTHTHATALIPAGSMVIGVSCRNTSAVAGDATITGYDVGISTDANAWGDNVSPLINETTDLTDATVTAPIIFAAATDVILTYRGSGTNFTAGGTVRVTVHYTTLGAPSTWLNVGILGDSKSTTAYNWGGALISHLNNDLFPGSGVYAAENLPRNWAVYAYTVAQVKSSIDSLLTGHAAYDYEKKNVFLINLGVNDYQSGLPVEATWKTNYLYIIDALVTAYPNAEIYISKPWMPGFDTSSDTMAGWIDDIVAARPANAKAGDDERAWEDESMLIPGSDHNNAAGLVAREAAIRVAIGY